MKFSELKKVVSEEGEGAGSVVPANMSGPDVSTDIPVVKPKDIKKYLFRRPKQADAMIKQETVSQWSGSSKPGVGPAEG